MSLLLGVLLDRLIGDPQSGLHPVALLGRGVSWVEARLYQDDVIRGFIAWCVIALPISLSAWWLLECAEAFSPWFAMALSGVAIWATIGWRSLFEHVELCRGAADLEERRGFVAKIVGRDLQRAEHADLRIATLESLSENASDAVVAPLFWAALTGPAGAVLFRVINTLDAMWGYRDSRFERFGRFAARVDDVACYVPARLTAICILAAGQCASFQQVWRDGSKHQSPNAGYPEAALAHVLGARLGGPVLRTEGMDDRAWVGPEGSSVAGEPDLGRGIGVVARALWLSLVVLIAVSWVVLQ